MRLALLTLIVLGGCAAPIYRPTEEVTYKSDEQIMKERQYLPLFK